MERDPVIVIGLGGIGSAVLAAIARRGVRVLGIDRLSPPHEMGSSHGGSRIIRAAYFEHPDYVPLAQEAFQGWERLESDTGRRCLHRCGVLLTGGPDSEVLRESMSAAAKHGIVAEEIERDALRQRWPMFEVPEDHRGLFEPDAGFVVPETGVAAHLEVARRQGAKILTGVEVEAIENGDHCPTVICNGRRVEATSVIVTAGAWTRRLLPELAAATLEPQRKAIVWCRSVQGREEEIDSSRMPAWLIDDEACGADGAYYGIPSHAGQIGPAGVKIGFHGPGVPLDPDDLGHEPDPEVMARFHREVSDYFPGLLVPPHAAKSCLYTMSTDQHFVIDRVPGRPQVVVAAGFSGHGFKFAPVLGERIADLVLGQEVPADLSFLGLSRFDEPQLP